MKIINMNELKNTEKDVQVTGCKSIRMLTKHDNMGFSLNVTNIPAGPAHHWHYKNHLEACYCIQGCGVLKNLETGCSFSITPGVLYVLDQHDNHTFQAIEDTVLISIFNPPLTGFEKHDENGNYPLQILHHSYPVDIWED